MSQFSFLSSQIENRKRDYTIYHCPYCGQENKINSSECRYCASSLLEYESIIFKNFNFYNEALEYAKNKNYLTAFEKIIVFLNDYSDDIQANRLKLFLLKKLNDKSFEEKAEKYISENNDRWVTTLVDNPKKISLSELTTKESFNGSLNADDCNFITYGEQIKQKLVTNIRETINSLYSIYVKTKAIKKIKDKLFSEFLSFYEKTFLLFMKKQDIQVIDLYHQNYNELDDEAKKCIGYVDTISNKKLPNGFISEVFFPEIRYRNFIIQKAKITVIKNN